MNDIAKPSTQPPQLIQIEESCFPYAEAGDLMELYPGDEFQGDGVYALQYVRSTRTWQGLRRVRSGACGLEIEERDGWAQVTNESRSVLRLLGRVERVLAPTPASLDLVPGASH